MIKRDFYKREILKKLRIADNRACADCTAPLSNVTSIFVACRFGTFICEACASIHKKLGPPPISPVRETDSDWNDTDFNIVVQAISNVEFNNMFEKYIPIGWRKCTPESSDAERLIWITAKYDSKLFFLPSSTSIESGSRKQGMQMDLQELPPRLIDFVGVGTLGSCLDYGTFLGNTSIENVKFDIGVSSFYPRVLPDLEMPQHMGMFLYPDGAHLSTSDVPPFFFTLVFTDEKGVKLYGGVLQIYDIIEPEEVASLMGHAVGSDQLPATSSKIVYSPKAIFILSHYPYFHLFKCLLEQFYRISLSSAPLPIERYVQNSCVEVPLPPRGMIEVAFTLADRTYKIVRPPKNQLPMVDFSYRPLFSCLSADNISIIFSFLCMEKKICFCSANIALLTPVQEAFLSLLFPFVWQGAYVPVITSTMLDVLDAPVPFVVGIHRTHLEVVGELVPVEGVILVDIDNDRIYYGLNDKKQTIPQVPLPAREAPKLKAKLVEFGECIYKSAIRETIEKTGRIFPRNEHLVPITSYASDDGITLSHRGIQNNTPAYVSISAAATPDEKEKAYIASTQTQCTRCSAESGYSLLDPSNNHSKGDKFDARELRCEFLRFFVSIFRDFQQYIVTGDSNDKRKSTKKDKDKDNSHENFRQDEFLNANKGPYFKGLVDTMMFAKFLEECIQRSDDEVLFFEESIISKMNRSSTVRTKLPTPFLDDMSGEITQTHVPPLPSNWGIPMSKRFNYLRFPNFKNEVFCPPRYARMLCRDKQRQRLRGSNAQEAVLKMTEEKRHMLIERKKSAIVIDGDLSIHDPAVITLLAESKARFFRTVKSVNRIKAIIRMRPLRSHYKRMRKAAKLIQVVYRKIVFRRLCEQYNVKQQFFLARIQRCMRRKLFWLHIIKFRRAALIQKHVRAFVYQARYKRALHNIILLQSLYRMRLAREQYRLEHNSIIKIQTAYRTFEYRLAFWKFKRAMTRIQSMFRAKVKRRLMNAQRATILPKLRKQIFELWKIEHTSLEYRARFWSFINKSTIIHLWLHKEELMRLWLVLNFKDSVFKNIKGSSFIKLVNAVEAYRASGQLAGDALMAPPRTADIFLEDQERLKLYTIMKTKSVVALNDSYFDMFNIRNQKNRKKSIVSLVWNDYTKADVSAKITLSVLDIEHDTKWLINKENELVRGAMVNIIQSCFIALGETGPRKTYRKW